MVNLFLFEINNAVQIIQLDFDFLVILLTKLVVFLICRLIKITELLPICTKSRCV